MKCLKCGPKNALSRSFNRIRKKLTWELLLESSIILSVSIFIIFYFNWMTCIIGFTLYYMTTNSTFYLIFETFFTLTKWNKKILRFLHYILILRLREYVNYEIKLIYHKNGCLKLKKMSTIIHNWNDSTSAFQQLLLPTK